MKTNTGVPHSLNANPGITMPLMAHQFRIVDCPITVTQHIHSCEFDMVKGEVEIKIRSSVLPQIMRDVMRFASSRTFTIQPMSNGVIYFGIMVHVDELLENTFKFDYAKNGVMDHILRFKINLDILEYEIVDKSELTKPSNDPNFPSPHQVLDMLNSSTKGASGESSLRQDSGC